MVGIQGRDRVQDDTWALVWASGGGGNLAGGQVHRGGPSVALLWKHSGPFAKFVSCFYVCFKEGCISVFQYVGIEHKKNRFLMFFKKLIFSSKTVLVLSSLSLK